MSLNIRNINFTVIRILLLILLQAYFSFSQERNPAQTGIDLFKAGKYNASLNFFRNLIKIKPGDPAVNYYLGASFIELKQFSDSAFHSLSYASQEPGFEKSFYYLGLLNQYTKDWNEAIKLYGKFKEKAGKPEVLQLNIDDLILRCYNKKGLPWFDQLIIGKDSTKIAASESIKDSIVLKPPLENKLKKNQGINQPQGNQTMNVWVESGTEVIKHDTALKASGQVMSLKTDNVIKDTLNQMKEPNLVQIIEPVEEETAKEIQEPKAVQKSDSVSHIKSIHAVKLDTISNSVKIREDNVNSIDFQINEDITYLKPAQFRTEKGNQLFSEGIKTKIRLDSLLNELNMLRKQYDACMNPTEKDKIGQRIIETEKESINLDPEVSDRFVEARRIENAYWSGVSRDEIFAFKMKTDSIRNEKRIASEKLNTIIDSSVFIINEPNPRKELTERKGKQGRKEEEAITYKIQLGTWKGNPSASFQNLIRKISLIRKIDTFKDEKGFTVYTTGILSKYSDAEEMMKQVKQEGIKNASVIAFKSGKKITLQEAINNSVQK